MSNDARDEFTEGVKRTVAERGAYICANPSCRRPTVGPHSDPAKSLKTGKACHIHAAAPGGPRYLAAQTREQRRSINNAMWLCSECSDTIDKDEKRFPATVLFTWKDQHESWLRDGGIVPHLPKITLSTLAGITVPEVPTKITLADLGDAREHKLSIENVSDVECKNLNARVQLPEPIVANFNLEKPVGVNVSWNPIRPQMQVLIKGGGSVTRNRPPLPSNVYGLQVDRIPPSHTIQFGFLTSAKVFESHDIPYGGPLSGMTNDDPSTLLYFIDGTFQFEYRGATLQRRFFGPIESDPEARQFSLLELHDNHGSWKPMILTAFS